MSQTRLTDLATLFIERDLAEKIDFDVVIKYLFCREKGQKN